MTGATTSTPFTIAYTGTTGGGGGTTAYRFDFDSGSNDTAPQRAAPGRACVACRRRTAGRRTCGRATRRRRPGWGSATPRAAVGREEWAWSAVARADVPVLHPGWFGDEVLGGVAVG